MRTFTFPDVPIDETSCGPVAIAILANSPRWLVLAEIRRRRRTPDEQVASMETREMLTILRRLGIRLRKWRNCLSGHDLLVGHLCGIVPDGNYLVTTCDHVMVVERRACPQGSWIRLRDNHCPEGCDPLSHPFARARVEGVWKVINQ